MTARGAAGTFSGAVVVMAQVSQHSRRESCACERHRRRELVAFLQLRLSRATARHRPQRAFRGLQSAARDPLLYSPLARPPARRFRAPSRRPHGPFTMSKDPILYDLVLLLSPESDEETRTKLLSD